MGEIRVGSCHCGAVKFQVSPAAEVDTFVRCNCSLCTRKNRGVWLVAEQHFELTCSPEALSVYRWNTQSESHFFCRTCGIHTHHTLADDPPRIGINVACLIDFDPEIVSWIHGDGASIPVVK